MKRDRLLTDDDFRARLRAACAEAGGLRSFARGCGFSPAYVSQVATGKEPPGERLGHILGLTFVRGWSNNKAD